MYLFQSLCQCSLGAATRTAFWEISISTERGIIPTPPARTTLTIRSGINFYTQNKVKPFSSHACGTEKYCPDDHFVVESRGRAGEPCQRGYAYPSLKMQCRTHVILVRETHLYTITVYPLGRPETRPKERCTAGTCSQIRSIYPLILRAIETMRQRTKSPYQGSGMDFPSK